MKGPGLKIELDVRRLWRCHECGNELRVSADYTTLRCGCASRPLMKLVADRLPVLRRPWTPAPEPEEIPQPERFTVEGHSDEELLEALERPTSPGAPPTESSSRPPRPPRRERRPSRSNDVPRPPREPRPEANFATATPVEQPPAEPDAFGAGLEAGEAAADSAGTETKTETESHRERRPRRRRPPRGPRPPQEGGGQPTVEAPPPTGD